MPGWSIHGGGRDRGKLRVTNQAPLSIDGKTKLGPPQIVVSGSFGALYLSELEAAELEEGLHEVLNPREGIEMSENTLEPQARE